MAYSPERGALIVDSQYENEDQQFLEEIHLSKSSQSTGGDTGSSSGDQGSGGFFIRDRSQPLKTYSRLRTIKTEPMDYDEQTYSENARSGQSFGEDYASPSESNQLDYYSANRQHVEHSSRKNYNGSSCSGVENGFHHEESSSVGNERMDQEPGPIGDDGEERQDNIRNGTDSLEAARAAWTPPTFRTCRPPGHVNWHSPRVRDVLRDYRNQKISSSRAVELIKKITGSLVSNATVRVKCRILDDLDAQYVESGNESRCSSEVGGSDGTDTSQSLRENGRIKCLQNRGDKPLIPGINAPIVAPPNSPYYLSFSRRFKQTSLTVPLNPDEVRLYRHASHSKSGRTIHFRCSRCDTLHQTYKSGEIARIKMVDGIVVSQLYPVHHERCKPIRLVEARAKEIERRCRKDIIQGMNPKEAWKKGRKAAISEATAAGFPVYGPGSILSAFPEWDKVKVLFGALRSRYIRRQMHAKQRMDMKGGKKNLDSDERKVEVADFDTAEVNRPKRPWCGQGGIYSSLRHDDGASASVLETVAVSEGEEIVGNDFELDDFEEESLYNFMQNAGKVANFNQAYNGGALNNNANSVFSRMPSNDSLTLDPIAVAEEIPPLFRGSVRQERVGAEPDSSRVAHELQEVERAIARAGGPSEQTPPEQITRPSVLTSARSSPSSSVFSAVASAEGISDERRTDLIRAARKRKRSEGGPEDYITFVSPAGVLPCARKKKKYTEEEALHKLREIEKCIAQYNALSDHKIATIHMTGNGDLKMYGSKYIIDACLHSSVVRNLKNKCRDKEEVDEEGVDDDELVSIPLVRCLPNLEINVAKNSDVRPMLNTFLDAMHFPWKPWFDNPHCPDYWPSTVPFYDPNNDLLSLSNLSQRKEVENHSIVDLERDILKYAYKHYTSFMEYHFGLSGPIYDEDQESNKDDTNPKNLNQSSVAVQSEPYVPQVSETRSSADFEREKLHSGVGQASVAHPGSSSTAPGISPTSDQHSGSLSIKSANDNFSASTSSTPAPVIPYEKAMDDQLALFRNSVLRVRYETMGLDVRTILESVGKIQNHSTCRTLVLFVDERNKLSVTGDKALISAFLSSNVPQCLLPAMSLNFDNQTITLPLLHLYEDSTVDQMSEDRALELLDDMMLHINFPWLDPYEGSQPDCWPPEIPFGQPWSNGGRGILNRRIGANTPGQAAKVVLKSVRWFYSEFILEKLNLEDGLKKVAPALAELTHKLLQNQERGSALQTPVPHSASSQEMSPFRVPGQVKRTSGRSSKRSYTSQLRTTSHYSSTSQDLRLLSHPTLAPPPEIRTEFTPQELPYRSRTGAESPSQHSVSSQETVPFRLPPHHPLATAHLSMQQQLPPSEQSYIAQSYETRPESYMMCDDRSIATLTPATSYIAQQEEGAQEQGAAVVIHSQIPATSQDFRMPRIPPQQALRGEDRTASWTSHHSPHLSADSRSSRSRRSSRHRLRTVSQGSVESGSSQQFVAPRHRYQMPEYNKSSAVRLPNQQFPAAAAASSLQHNPYMVEQGLTAGSFVHSESPSYRTSSPYTSEHVSMHEAKSQGLFTLDPLIPQIPPQQAAPPQDFVAPRNPPPQQPPAEEGYLRVLCSCGPGTELDSRDCLRCDRCRKYFHDKCLPLRRRDRSFLCASCLSDVI